MIAISTAGSNLHHALAEGHVGHGVLTYVVVFFGIWWAWMNFSWFATSFDTDDWLYRILTFVQMGGVLVLASGIEPMFTGGDATVLILAYVVMRLGLVAQWLRASRCGGEAGRAARIYAIGIVIVQALWLLMLLLPASLQLPAIALLILAELSVPTLAETFGGRTPWHAHHITERYSLFTLIVLGESLLASANAIIGALHEAEDRTPLILLAVLAMSATAALWWLYFWPPHHRAIGSLRSSLLYGYGHFFVLGAAAAFSAGIELEISVLAGESEVLQPGASFAYTVPLAVFILGVWILAVRRSADRIVNIAVPLAGILVLIDPLIPVPFALTAVILTAMVAVLTWRSPLPEGRIAA